MYHELGLPGRKASRSEQGYLRYVVHEPEFWQQMRVMQLFGLRGISVNAALQFPDLPSMAITFDDGAETDLLNAAPILHDMGFGATFFVTVGFLGQPGYMSKKQAHELSDQGFEIGSHSMTHPYLPDLDEGTLRHEIVDSKSELENITGRPVEHFSCPGGRYDQRAIDVARSAGYRSFANSRLQANSPASDRFALGRVAVLRDTPLGVFSHLCRGGGLKHLSMQASLRDHAKRLLGNTLYDRVRATLVGDRQS